MMAYGEGIGTDADEEDQMSYSLQLLSDGRHDLAADRNDENADGEFGGHNNIIHRNWRKETDEEFEHRAMVCSRCCVERGPDGEVRCLGCLMEEKVG